MGYITASWFFPRGWASNSNLKEIQRQMTDALQRQGMQSPGRGPGGTIINKYNPFNINESAVDRLQNISNPLPMQK